MDRKLKGIPVYVMALILVSGTVLGAGIWFLTVDVPVDYSDPVEITMYSERDAEGQIYPDDTEEMRLRTTNEHTQPADLVYETYHQHITFDNPDTGRDHVEILVSLEAQDNGGSLTNDIGFAVFEGEIRPEDVTWEYDGEGEEWEADGEEIDRETTEFSLSLDGDDEHTWTVVYTNRDRTGEGDPYDVDGYTIEWFFEDTSDETPYQE